MAINTAVTGVPIPGYGRDVNEPLQQPQEGSSPNTWMSYIHALQSENARIHALNQNLLGADDAAAGERQRADNLEEKVQILQARNAQLLSQAGDASSFNPSPPIPTPAEPRHVKSAKQPDPELFDGDRSKFQVFRSNLRMKLVSNADWFDSEQSKLQYCLARLTGTARKRFEYKIQWDGSVEFETVKELFDTFENAFGDPYRAQHAKKGLAQCFQKSGGFDAWFAEFQTLTIDSGYEDTILLQLLEQNASKEYAKKLYTQNKEPLQTYQELVRKFQAIEDCFRLVNNHGYQPRSHLFTPSSSRPAAPRITTTIAQVQAPSTASGTHSGPMDVSVARGPLSDAEKQRRRANRLCLFAVSLVTLLEYAPCPSGLTFKWRKPTSVRYTPVQSHQIWEMERL